MQQEHLDQQQHQTIARIKSASILIQEYSNLDYFPDLSLLVNNKLSKQTPEPDSCSTYQYLRKDNFISFPDFIYQQYDTLQCKSFMGLFPSLNRVWITIDNRLYLWNYNSSGDLALNTFDDQEQIIVSVALVKPIPGVFLPQIEYILVVTTPIDVILLGVAFTSSDVSNSRGPMTLYRTDLSISTDNINMISVLGTELGRIFMVGNDGNLYELKYQSEEGWFTRKIRKLNHSSSSFARMVVPPFMKWATEDNLKLIAVDDSRNCLYTLSKEHSITLIYLGVDGQGFNKIVKLSNIYQKSSRFFEQSMGQMPLEERNFEIVSLHPVLKGESKLVQLMALTSSGHRLYFSHFKDFNSQQWNLNNNVQNQAPYTLIIAYVRPPIGPSSSYGYSSVEGPRGALIHKAYYSGGLTIAANSFTEEIDRILGFSIDSGAISQLPDPKHLIEMSNFIDLKGKTWDIAEATGSFTKKSTSATIPGSLLNELANQFEIYPRSFRLLSNEGITVLTKLRPLDILFQLISNNQESRLISEFFEKFGKDQSCAMCLAIICGHSCIRLAKEDSIMPQITPSITNMAIKLYFELGGKPLMGQNSLKFGPAQSGGLLGFPLASFKIRNSAKHNGLAIYISRILRSIWNERIAKDGLSQDTLENNFNVPELIVIQSHLQSLDTFLNQYKGFTALPTPDSRPAGVDAEAWKAEQESLSHLHELITHSIEAISFLTMLIDYRFSSITSSLPKEILLSFKLLTFEGLITTLEGRNVGKALMTALVNNQILEESGVDAISDTLQLRCPTICQPNDVIMYKGMELIQTAKGQTQQEQRTKTLYEAQRLFSSIIKDIDVDRLKEITESFISLRFYVGVVDLCIKRASIEENTINNSERNDYYLNVKKQEYFNIIFEMLAHLNEIIRLGQSQNIGKDASNICNVKDQVLKKALACEDELFHWALYSWYIGQNLIDELLSIKSPFIEKFLLSDKENTEMKNLLWKFYVLHHRFSDASLVLSELADSPGLNLQKRIEFLTMAVSNAKSATAADYSTSNTVLASMTDALHVARIQMEVYNIINSRIGFEEAAEDLNNHLVDVNELYHKYARPLHLHEITLLILHTSNLGIQGRALVEFSWNEIIKKAAEDAENGSRPIFDGLKDKIRELGLLYYPDENVFPLKFLISKLEQESFETNQKPERGWLINTLREINVPYHSIFSVLHDLFETKLSPWSSNKALTYLIEDIHFLLRDWVNLNRQLGSSREFSEFPARFVDEAISKYLVTISSDCKQLSSNLHQIQNQIRQSNII